MAALFFALEARLLWNLGLGLNLRSCGVCGASLQESEAALFRPADGDLSCPRCARGAGKRVSAQELRVWRGLEEVLDGSEAVALSESQRRQIGKWLHLHMSYHLPHYKIPKALYWLSDLRGGEGADR